MERDVLYETTHIGRSCTQRAKFQTSQLFSHVEPAGRLVPFRVYKVLRDMSFWVLSSRASSSMRIEQLELNTSFCFLRAASLVASLSAAFTNVTAGEVVTCCVFRLDFYYHLQTDTKIGKFRAKAQFCLQKPQ